MRKGHARETMIESLRKSIVIITDNQRYSVAITYDINSDEDDPVPIVAAKGEGTVFRWINHEAENVGIDLFESPFLACMLFISTDLGQEISRDHYYPVAQVIAFVVQSRYANDYRLRKPKPDKYILRNMGLNIKTALHN